MTSHTSVGQTGDRGVDGTVRLGSRVAQRVGVGLGVRVRVAVDVGEFCGHGLTSTAGEQQGQGEEYGDARAHQWTAFQQLVV